MAGMEHRLLQPGKQHFPERTCTEGVHLMSTEENKATVRRLTEEGWNQGNLAVFDELNAPIFIYHDPGAPDVRTIEDYKRWVTENRSVFPDLHFTIEDLIAEGDQLVGR